MNEEIKEALDDYAFANRAFAWANHSEDKTYIGVGVESWDEVREKNYTILSKAIEDYKNNNNPVTNLEIRISSLEKVVKGLIPNSNIEFIKNIPWPNQGPSGTTGDKQLDLFPRPWALGPDYGKTVKEPTLADLPNHFINPMGRGSRNEH